MILFSNIVAQANHLKQTAEEFLTDAGIDVERLAKFTKELIIFLKRL